MLFLPCSSVCLVGLLAYLAVDGLLFAFSPRVVCVSLLFDFKKLDITIHLFMIVNHVRLYLYGPCEVTLLFFLIQQSKLYVESRVPMKGTCTLVDFGFKF